MPTYTYADFKSRINSKIKGKIGILVNPRDTINEIARQVYSDVDLVSARRRTALTPNLFTKIFEYASPSDIKGYALINIEPQTDRARAAYNLCPSEEFYRRRDPNAVAIDDADFIKKILVNTYQPVQTIGSVIATLDTVESGGGTWVAVGDATNVTADSSDYVRENGSIRFDIGSGATTTAGIKNTGLTAFDATPYFGGDGAAFIWTKINSATNLTNFVLQIGSSDTSYYTHTITAASDGTGFRAGWNLLRFDLSKANVTGSPVLTAIDFISVFMTKTSGKINELNYRFDSLQIRKGERNNVVYYSKYPWQTAAGVYIAESTAESDLLNVDDDEYNLMIEKGKEIAGEEVDEIDLSTRAAKNYKNMVKDYVRNNPSEAMNMISMTADFKHT